MGLEVIAPRWRAAYLGRRLLTTVDGHLISTDSKRESEDRESEQQLDTDAPPDRALFYLKETSVPALSSNRRSPSTAFLISERSDHPFVQTSMQPEDATDVKMRTARKIEFKRSADRLSPLPHATAAPRAQPTLKVKLTEGAFLACDNSEHRCLSRCPGAQVSRYTGYHMICVSHNDDLHDHCGTTEGKTRAPSC